MTDEPFSHTEANAPVPTVWSLLLDIRTDVKSITSSLADLSTRVTVLEQRLQWNDIVQSHERQLQYLVIGLGATIIVGLISAASNIISHWH